jgi:hypothetical protein
VELRCTCGAILPEDARFCHKCGKPQKDEDIERFAATERTSTSPEKPLNAGVTTDAKSVPIGFSNIRAVAITMGVAALAVILLAIFAMLAPPLGVLVLCAAGYAAAWLYKRQSAQPLTAGAGAYLGVMTGLWLFLVLALFAALIAVEVGTPAGREMLRAGLSQMPETAKMLDDPHQMMVNIAEGLIPMFFLATVSGAFGGMLAARTFARRSQP